ncbi:MAG: GTP cyclohydrolase I FolE [Eubacterium sp.]|nr:GTP cyclohydrolase I FolE [Eubacterium sp.]
MSMDLEKIREHVRGILEAIGEDPDRPGLAETPDRVARMYQEVFEGIQYSNDDIAAMFNKTFPITEGTKKDIVLVRDISAFSYCEHHMALMYDMKISVAYVPTDRVIGISKIARVADMVCKRLQLQERIGADIAEIIGKIAGTEDVAVLISGNHSCMTARGIKNMTSETVTLTVRGAFETDHSLKEQILALR